jgi:hypothetical protein
MGERRRLADDLVGVPRWARGLVYGVYVLMAAVSVVAAVLFLPWFAYRLLGGLPALIVMVVLEIVIVGFVIAMRRSPRVRRWYTGREDGRLVVDTTRWRHWDRFIP